MNRFLIGTVVLFGLGAAFDSIAKDAASGDLAIGFDSKTDRPNAFIAWRNSQRILEVEVDVKNLGEKQVTGRVYLAVLDESGRTLASNEKDPPQIVQLPPASARGSDGKIVQVKGNLALNLLIDKLDRANKPYLLKAWIASPDDPNQINNVAVKTFNIPSRALPGGHYFRDFMFQNTTDKPVSVRWDLSTSTLPRGWNVSSSFPAGTRTTVEPGQTVHGHLTVETAANSKEGDHVDLRVIGRNEGTNTVAYNYEWFVVNDVTPPAIKSVSHEVTKEHELSLAATVDDQASMLKEASGIRAEYSTDNGVTFSSRVMAYSAGNFVGPTSFTASIGPFAGGTNVVGRIVATDIAGNSTEHEFGPIKITNISAGSPGPQAKVTPRTSGK